MSQENVISCRLQRLMAACDDVRLVSNPNLPARRICEIGANSNLMTIRFGEWFHEAAKPIHVDLRQSVSLDLDTGKAMVHPCDGGEPVEMLFAVSTLRIPTVEDIVNGPGSGSPAEREYFNTWVNKT